MVDSYKETPAEEVVNCVTHGVSALVTLGGLGAFLEQHRTEPLALLATTIFGFTLFLMFFASSVYHGCTNVELKKRLQLFDHVAIYLLIAGSYTPYCLLALPSSHGLPVLALVWVMAAVGSLFEIRFGIRYPAVGLFFYLALGWMATLILPHLTRSLCGPSLTWLIVGGLSYTVGAIFYARHWFRFSHGVWHLFVMAGGACHFSSVWLVAEAFLRS